MAIGGQASINDAPALAQAAALSTENLNQRQNE
jgi:hypothetical protein